MDQGLLTARPNLIPAMQLTLSQTGMSFVLGALQQLHEERLNDVPSNCHGNESHHMYLRVYSANLRTCAALALTWALMYDSKAWA